MAKIGHNGKATGFENGKFVSKIKIAKKVPKTSLATRQNCSVQKSAPKNT